PPAGSARRPTSAIGTPHHPPEPPRPPPWPPLLLPRPPPPPPPSPPPPSPPPPLLPPLGFPVLLPLASPSGWPIPPGVVLASGAVSTASSKLVRAPIETPSHLGVTMRVWPVLPSRASPPHGMIRPVPSRKVNSDFPSGATKTMTWVPRTTMVAVGVF